MYEVSALFPFLKIAVIFASFQALGTWPESTDDWKISCIIGVRWEAYLFRNNGGMPSAPCDLEVLIFDRWSCTPLNEIVSFLYFSICAVVQICNLELPSCVKTLLN